MDLPRGDKEFLNKALSSFNLPKVAVLPSPSAQRWPDIWCYMEPPTIVVTREWARQPLHERRKRLVHELLHFRGLNHGRQGNLVYSTYPAKDSYSRAVYEDMFLKGNPTLTLPTASDLAKFRVTTKLVRSRSFDPELGEAVTRPEIAARAVSRITASATEILMAIYLDTRNIIIGIQQISKGERAASLVPIDHIVRTAILSNAAGIILAHNHPSEWLNFSPEDIAVTKRLKEAAKLFGIDVLDSLIVAEGMKFASMKDKGLL